MASIKLSKSQWEMIGKKAGWMKVQSDAMPKKKCNYCHGEGFIYQKIRNLGTLEYSDSRVVCPACGGKGYITKEDHDSYMHSLGIGPCPHDAKK